MPPVFFWCDTEHNHSNTLPGYSPLYRATLGLLRIAGTGNQATNQHPSHLSRQVSCARVDRVPLKLFGTKYNAHFQWCQHLAIESSADRAMLRLLHFLKHACSVGCRIFSLSGTTRILQTITGHFYLQKQKRGPAPVFFIGHFMPL